MLQQLPATATCSYAEQRPETESANFPKPHQAISTWYAKMKPLTQLKLGMVLLSIQHPLIHLLCLYQLSLIRIKKTQLLMVSSIAI